MHPDQSYYERSTGITMALTDLDTFSAVQTGMVSVANTLKAGLTGGNGASEWWDVPCQIALCANTRAQHWSSLLAPSMHDVKQS